MAENQAIIAVAGSRKTETVIEGALEDPTSRVLITTYTLENLAQIIRRIEARAGIVPKNVTVMSWFSFLIEHAVRPYQYSVLDGINFIRGLNFPGQHSRYVSKSEPQRYFLDSNQDIYRNGVSDFVCEAQKASGGALIGRLERRFDKIFIDEVQDLVGYDLEFLDLLFASRIAITVVGDPRQYTLETNTSPKNKKYRGARIVDWLGERSDVCACENRVSSDRCNQRICDFASTVFPDFEPLESTWQSADGQDGIHFVTDDDLPSYVAAYRPRVLRWSRAKDTRGLDAINIGVSKGSTYDRVLIFPTKAMRAFLKNGDPTKLPAREKLYVAVTRARHSVGFVV